MSYILLTRASADATWQGESAYTLLTRASADAEWDVGVNEMAEGIQLLLGDVDEQVTSSADETAEGILFLLGDAEEDITGMDTVEGIQLLLGDAGEVVGVGTNVETVEGIILLLGDADEQTLVSSVLSDTADATDSGAATGEFPASGSSAGDASATLVALGTFPSDINDRTAANADTASAIGEFPLAYLDTVSATDAIAFTFLLQYADTGDVTDELAFTFLLAFRELVTAVDTLALTGEYPLSLSSTGSITDALGFVFPLYMESTANATDSLDILRLLRLISTARAQASSLSTLEITLAITTLAHAQDSLGWANLAELSDTADASDELVAMVTAAAKLADIIDASDTTSWTLGLFAQLRSSAQATDTSTSTVELLTKLLSAGHSVVISLTLGEDEDRYLGHVINTESGAVGFYDNVPFDSLAWSTHGKQLFAVKPDGLYVFDASDDAGTPIKASLTTGVHDFQTNLLKRIDDVLLGYSSDGQLRLRVVTTEGGRRTERVYAARSLLADTPRETVIDVGRGIEFSYVQFVLENTTGADFEVDKMTIYPVALQRRRNS